MTTRCILIAVAAALAGLTASPAPAAYAQDGTRGPVQAPAEEDIRQRAAQVQRRVEALSRMLSFHLDDARRGGDRARATCLDRTLSQSNAVLRMLALRVERMGSEDSEDAVRPGHELTVLRVLERRVGVLESGMRACNGEQANLRTGTQVLVEIARDVPREDPTVLRPVGRVGSPALPPPAGPTI